MTRTPKPGPAARAPAEIREYNDRVWDMVLYKVNPVAIFVILQICLFTRFTGHPGLRGGLGFLVFGTQFLGAWSVLQGTLLREMGYVSLTPLLMACWTLVGLVTSFLIGDPLALESATLRLGTAIYLLPMLVVWALTLVRWRRLKRHHAAELGQP
ncbi:MAG: hypothetical protein H6807_07930 [Planctomycetes bacterium]|nr:hypothetical protein [Planctomycetota bacterium]